MDKVNLFYAILIATMIYPVSSCIGPATSIDIDEEEVPEKTVSIIVETDMTNEAVYEKLVQLLYEKGYTLVPDTEIVDAVPENFTGMAEKWNADDSYIRLDIAIEGTSDAVVTIRGWFTAPVYEDLPGQLERQIAKDAYSGPVAREAWIEMFEIAWELDGYMRYES